MFGTSVGRNFVNTNYHVSHYALQALGNQVINRKDPTSKRRKAIEITSHHCRALLEKLNVEISVDFQDPSVKEQNFFMVCNHMSYVDILVLSSLRSSVFVTSVEMEKTFFLGDMAKLGGSFFVDRVNRRKMKSEVEALESLLRAGFNVFIFPEGTSTNGQKILPFKKSLFRVPFQTGFPILPICLKYESIDGEVFSESNCDRICWYDDMTFAPHFLKMMQMKELRVSVQYLKPLLASEFSNHSELAQTAQSVIESHYFS